MDLRRLRYFVAVAEELHFSRAATRLDLAQSALSAQIRQLEREIGGPLLHRTTRQVELTPAGRALLSDARDIIARMDNAVGRARSLARGESGVLIIGALGPAPGAVLDPVLARFRPRHPEVRIEMRAFDFADTFVALRERRADVAFLYLPIDDPELLVTPLLTEPRVVVLPRNHRLAERPLLRPADVAGEVFVTQPDSIPRAWRNFWLLCDQLGRRPELSSHVAGKLEEWLHVIARGEGIDTCPALISRYYPWPELAFVPLVDAPPATLALACRRDDHDALVAEFIDLAVQVSGGSPGAQSAAGISR